MIRGMTVTIIGRTQSGLDPGGDPIWTETEERVDGVLIQDGTQANGTASTSPEGISVDRTIHMPRSWPYHSLRGSRIRLPDGVEYTVIGDPLPYDGGLAPTRWNLTVQLHDERG
ncbi:phage protein [Bifidobacterium sp. DSM 109960]|uniref:Phage protein n=2 Tax=Bifidobacterium TaxID=1678 RepID=A0A7Y0ETT4_9BIFI|nr:phage protein [Bifidobacterium sp. DSM 109960]